jgi:predicted transcriptional regulator
MAITDSLRGVKVQDVMTREFPTVESHTNVQTLVDDYFLRSGRRCLFVTENGKVTGLITPHEAQEIERNKWPYTTVDQIMRAFDQLKTVSADAQLLKALELMGAEDLNQLPVVANGSVAGIVSRGHIMQLLKTRAELRT